MIYLEKRYYLCIEDIKGLTDGGTVEKNRAQEVTWFVWKSTCLSSYTYWLLLLNFLPNYSQRPKDMDGHHVNLSISQNTDPLSLFRWKDLSRSLRLLFLTSSVSLSLILLKVLVHFAVEHFLNFACFLLHPKSWLTRVTGQYLIGYRLSLFP